VAWSTPVSSAGRAQPAPGRCHQRLAQRRVFDTVDGLADEAFRQQRTGLGLGDAAGPALEDEIRIEHYVRQADQRWLLHGDWIGADSGPLTLVNPPVTLPLAAVYDGVEVQ
jgi:hypothetical protein